jgi:LPPG:FO 2-phospho-L-lactate transferase
MILALAGGVGGAKLAQGLATQCAPDDLTIVVNTGDDFEHLGLPICPDLDTVMYTLAGIANPETGWGQKDESWNFMAALAKLGGPDWFRLGDRDIATHITRRARLAEGLSLSQVTAELCAELGIKHRIVPMSDNKVATRVETDRSVLDFQDYFVRQQCRPVATGFRFDGADRATPHTALLQGLREADAIVICPSNPFVSIGPILALLGVEAALRQRRAPAIAVSPIVGGQAIKGPAAKMFAELGLDCSALGVARWYGELLDGIVIDTVDAALAPRIEALGQKVLICDTIMRNDVDRAQLARRVLDFVAGLK